jgi:hypothetical protein
LDTAISKKIIPQPLVHLLTPRLQRLPEKSRLGRTSSFRWIVILPQTTKNIISAPRFSGTQTKHPNKKKNKKTITA